MGNTPLQAPAGGPDFSPALFHKYLQPMLQTTGDTEAAAAALAALCDRLHELAAERKRNKHIMVAEELELLGILMFAATDARAIGAEAKACAMVFGVMELGITQRQDVIMHIACNFSDRWKTATSAHAKKQLQDLMDVYLPTQRDGSTFTTLSVVAASELLRTMSGSLCTRGTPFSDAMFTKVRAVVHLAEARRAASRVEKGKAFAEEEGHEARRKRVMGRERARRKLHKHEVRAAAAARKAAATAESDAWQAQMDAKAAVVAEFQAKKWDAVLGRVLTQDPQTRFTIFNALASLSSGKLAAGLVKAGMTPQQFQHSGFALFLNQPANYVKLRSFVRSGLIQTNVRKEAELMAAAIAAKDGDWRNLAAVLRASSRDVLALMMGDILTEPDLVANLRPHMLMSELTHSELRAALETDGSKAALQILQQMRETDLIDDTSPPAPAPAPAPTTTVTDEMQARLAQHKTLKLRATKSVSELARKLQQRRRRETAAAAVPKPMSELQRKLQERREKVAAA